MAGEERAVRMRSFCQRAGERDTPALSDAELLGRFTARGDEAAFAALVRRHGPLVLRVCRHVLHQEQDAEDAFQAAFLVLARKAASIRRGRSLASWLHGVACRTASNARRIAMRRRQHEQEAPARTVEPTASAVALRELQTIVDEEVARLPVKYRAPLVLCCLEGKSRAEAAATLGWREGTVSSRLAQARTLLEQGLARRGVALSAALGAYAVLPGKATASIPTGRAAQVARAAWSFLAGNEAAAGTPATALAKVVLREMGATQAYLLVALTVALSLLFGGGFAAVIHSQGESPEPGRADRAEQTVAKDSVPGNAESHREAPVDRLGDPLPPHAVARLGTVRFRQGDRVSGVAFSPDGRTLASAGWDTTVRLWESATGKELRALTGLQRAAVSVAFAPRGGVLATGTWFGPVTLWETTTGKRLRDLPGSPGGFSAIAFAPDGKTIAIGGSCADSVRLWETATGKEVRHLSEGRESFPSSNDSDTSVAFSPDGKVLAAAHGPVIRLWQVQSARLLRCLSGHKERVTAVAFSGDGHLLASGGQDGAIILWEADGGKEGRRLAAGKGGGVNGLAFSPDGKLLTSARGDGQLALWDAITGGELCQTGGYQSGLMSSVLSVAFAPRGRMLAAGYYNGTIRAWKLPQDDRVLRTPAVAASWFERSIGHDQGHQEGIEAVAVSPDGKTVATACGDGTLGLWERVSGKPIRRWKGHDGRCDGVTFSPDGRLLATSGIDDKVCLWELPAGKLRPEKGTVPLSSRGLSPFPVRRFPGNQVAFSPDGKLLASTSAAEGLPWGAGYRDIVLRETITGKERLRLRKHPGNVRCLVFSPDGRTLASGAAAQRTEGPNVDQAPRVIHTIRLWDLARGQERLRFGGDRYSVDALAFSPDGRTLASGRWTSGSFQEGGKPDAPVQLWETATGKERGRLEGHSGSVSSVAFSPDGQLVAAGGMDRTVRVWEVRTQKQVARLVGHRAAVTAVAFLPDGRAVLSGSRDTTALIWALPPGTTPR